MYFDNIINQISQLIFVYYSEYRIRKQTPLCEHHDINMIDLLEYINSTLKGLYIQTCSNKRIIAMDTLLWPDEKMYWFGPSSKCIRTDDMNDIKCRIQEYVKDRGIIFNSDEVITIICEHNSHEPVEKFQITHGMIIGILELCIK